MDTISASAARQTLPAQLDRVESGEQVAIRRHGRVIAVLAPPDAVSTQGESAAQDLADHVRALLEQARSEPLHAPALQSGRADVLVAALRSGRETR